MTKVKALVLKYWKECLLLLCLILMIVMTFHIHSLRQELHEQQEAPVVMTPTEAQDTNALENALDVNHNNATSIQREIIKAQHGLTDPVATYTITTNKTVTESLPEVAQDIKDGKRTLPKEALEKTDKTVVVDQPENKTVPIGVYKINTYRNWEIGTGVGWQDGEAYIPVSLQRNYDKIHSVALEAHYDIDDRKINGGEVQYKFRF